MNHRVLAVAAVAEATTGLVLLAWPSVFVRLLLDADVDGIGVGMSRLTGAALIGLGIACWPRPGEIGQAYAGMLAYGALAALLLSAMGIAGHAGILLWPAVVVHLLLTLALGVAWARGRRNHF